MAGDPRVRIIEKSVAYRGYVEVQLWRLSHRRHDGGWTGELTREVIERGHAVAVLPYDPVRDRLVLLEQFRPGALAAGVEPWQVEIVAGMIGAGESPEQVARRETFEECGCTVAALEQIGDILTSPGIMSETLRLYCGQVDAAATQGAHGLAHEDEDIRTFTLAPGEAAAWLAEGRILHSPTVIALHWFAQHHDRLRQAWAGEETP